MASVPTAAVLDQVIRMIGKRQQLHSADERLVQRVVITGDESAFTELVERHGPLVLGVCRRVLGNRHDAEDAFQATFLVFARKANSIRKGSSVGSWLYGVANRVAQKAKVSAARRRRHERAEAPMQQGQPRDEIARQEALAILDEELCRLPEKYRSPLVLCRLQGKTHEEAAEELGRAAGSMSRYLERGQELLRQRLLRRGVSLSLALLASTFVESAGAAQVLSAGLKQTTIKAASAYAVGPIVAGGASAPAVIAEGVLHAMRLARMAAVAGVLLTLGLAGAGTGLLVHQVLGIAAGPLPISQSTLADSRQPTLTELLRDLRAASFEVRQGAEKSLMALGVSALPDLRQALAKEKDLDAIGRLERVIRTIEREAMDRRAEECRRLYGIRGDRIAVARFGPFEPGPVDAEVLAPEVGSWIDGSYFLLLLHNRGNKPVDIRWVQTTDPQTGWKEPEVRYAAGGGGTLNLSDVRLAPGKSWAYVHYHSFWNRNGVQAPQIGLDLNGHLQQEGKKGVLRIGGAEPMWKMTLREPSKNEVKDVVKEVAQLGRHGQGQFQQERLRYLLNYPRGNIAFQTSADQPIHQLSPDQLRAAYEWQAGRDFDVADHFLDALIAACSEKEMIAFATERVRAGDGLPLRKCAAHLPRDLVVPSVLKLLKAKEPGIRWRAVDFLATINEQAAGPQIAELFTDPDAGVRQAAIRAIQKLRHPCPERISALLTDADEVVRREAAETLVLLQAKEQIPAIRQALSREMEPSVSAGFLRALGKLGGKPDEVRAYLGSRHSTIRAGAIEALADLGATAELDGIARLLEAREGGDTTGACIYALGKFRSRKHVNLIGKAIASHDAYGEVGFTALGEIGGEEAIAALREFAVDRPIALDHRVGRAIAVKSLAKLLPQGQRLQEMADIAKNAKANELARDEALRQLDAFGKPGARLIQDVVADPQVGTEAMVLLSRYSAAKRFAQPTTFDKPPLQGWNVTFGQLTGLLGFPVHLESVDGLAGERLWLYREPVTLPEILLAVARSRDNTLGVILTDDSLRIVPRAKAVEFHRQLSLD